jgi:hypothetical protein
MADSNFLKKDFDSEIIDIRNTFNWSDSIKNQGQKIADFNLVRKVLNSNKYPELLKMSKKSDMKFLTGTFIAYETPDIAFDKCLIFENIVLKIPEKYQGLKNSALMFESFDSEFKDKNIEVIPKKIEYVIGGFPKQDLKYNIKNAKFQKNMLPLIGYGDREFKLLRESNEYVGPIIYYENAVQNGKKMSSSATDYKNCGIELRHIIGNEYIVMYANPVNLSSHDIGYAIRSAKRAEMDLAEIEKFVKEEKIERLKELVRIVKELEIKR